MYIALPLFGGGGGDCGDEWVNEVSPLLFADSSSLCASNNRQTFAKKVTTMAEQKKKFTRLRLLTTSSSSRLLRHTSKYIRVIKNVKEAGNNIY